MFGDFFKKIELDYLRSEGFDDPEAELDRRHTASQAKSNLKDQLEQQNNKIPEVVKAAIERNNYIDLLEAAQLQIESANIETLKVTKKSLAEHLPWSTSRYNEWAKKDYVNAVIAAIKESRVDDLINHSAMTGSYSEASAGYGPNAFKFGDKQGSHDYFFIMLDSTPYLFDRGHVEYRFQGFNYPENHVKCEAASVIHDRYILMFHEIEDGIITELEGNELERLINNLDHF